MWGNQVLGGVSYILRSSIEHFKRDGSYSFHSWGFPIQGYGIVVGLRKWQMAIHFLREMEKTMQSNVVVHSAVISACEKAEQWQEALTLLEESIDQSFGNLFTYSSTISACVSGTQWERALLLHGGLLERRLQPNRVTLTALMQACVRGRLWQEAMHFFWSMKPSEVDLTALSAAMEASAKTKRWSQVLWLLRSTSSLSYPHEVCLSKLGDVAIEACSASSQWQEALEVFQELQDLQGLQRPRRRLSLLCYCAALSACEKTDPRRCFGRIATSLAEACEEYWLTWKYLEDGKVQKICLGCMMLL